VRNYMKNFIKVLVLFGVVTSPAFAAKPNEAAINKIVKEVFGVSQADAIAESVLPGVYEVRVGAQVVYMSGDARYAVQGDIIDLKNRENITETTRTAQRAKLIKKIDPKTLIVFKPKEKTKHVVTVFTDIDCGYCQKLHSEIDQYTNLGIEIRYAAFPRSGANTKSYFKAVTVWCSENQLSAMTDSKAGKVLPRKDCTNPVETHMTLAGEFGVSGTPTMVLEDGTVIPGYVPAPKLLSILEGDKRAAM